MSSNNWKMVELGDVVDSISQKHKFDKDEIILINTSDVLEGKVLNHQYVPNQNLKGQFKKSFKKNDILYSEIRPQNKRFAYINFDSRDYVASTKLMVLRKKNDKITSEFLYQILKSDEVINKLQVIAESRSGTFPQITFGELSRLDIQLPPIDEQKAIAANLSCLDDKIELNNKITQNLEEMAQAIFKSWFVEFEPFQEGGFEDSDLGRIPKGWRVGTLDECIEFYNGYAFKSKELLDSECGDCYHVFKMGHIKKGGGFNSEGTKSWIEKSKCANLLKYVLKKGDLLICMTDMKGNVALLGHTALMNEDDKYVVNQRVGLLRANNNYDIKFPYLYILTNYSKFIENLRGRANSGVQVNLSTSEIKASKVLIAPKEINTRFNEVVMPLFKKMFEIVKENQNLIALRDCILPKLMSGEIRVPIEEVQ